MDRQLTCFISFSTEDKDDALQIQKFLEKENIVVENFYDSNFQLGISIFEDLQDSTSSVDFVIILVPPYSNSDTSQRDNMIFEIGYMLGMGVPLITLIKDEPNQKLPTNLHDIMYLKYKSSEMVKNFDYIKKWISKYVE